MDGDMRKIESSCSLIERIEQLNISTPEKLTAIENVLRAQRFAELFLGLSTGISKLANVLVVKPVQRGIALISRYAS